MARIDVGDVVHDLVIEVRLCRRICLLIRRCFDIERIGVLSDTARRKATCHASSATLRATAPCDSGYIVRFEGPAELPHGAVLSCCASHTRSGGQRKATGPMLDPSSPSPCVCAWLKAATATNIVRSVVRMTEPDTQFLLTRLRITRRETRYMSSPKCCSFQALQSCAYRPRVR